MLQLLHVCWLPEERILPLPSGAVERRGYSPPSVRRGGLRPPQIDAVPNCTASNKIEIL